MVFGVDPWWGEWARERASAEDGDKTFNCVP